MAPAKILVVDDEPSIVKSIQYSLEKEGYVVVTASDGQQALEVARREKPNLMVLDVMMPLLDGYEVCRQLRQEMPIPVIMLTAKGEEIDKVVGLEIGADEYVTKPFSLRELLARVKALLRLVTRYGEAKQAQPDKIEIGDLIIDLTRHEVTLGGRVLNLTLKEYELLKLLALNANKVLSREYLIEQVWGYDFTGEGRTVDVHIHWLREKIEKDPNHPMRIQTVRGVGYRFERRTRPAEVS
ncbi:MAG: response regulator transcription factor [Candidatus Sericytochromatia bacterium]|nr:response regulator transcription factor [Candidatus Sericytochromatia bacterium]